jgi:murein DD-endopeptidase MepM/ murein hydrolase activator NlpD
MRFVVGVSRSRMTLRALAVAMVAFGIAGCSSEATRFSDKPEITNSVPPAQPAPTTRVQQSQLPPPQNAQLPPPTVARPATVATQPQPGIVGGRKGLATYTPPQATPIVTGSVQPSAQPPAQPAQTWTWDGGTAITVNRGDTIHSIARRHGVPPDAIMQANNISATTPLKPGQRLVIPRLANAPAPVATAPSTQPANAGVHVVAPGETLFRIARLYGKPVAEIARANSIPPHTRVNVGDRIIIPGAQAQVAPRTVAPPKIAQPQQTPPVNQRVVSNEPPPQNVRMVQTAEPDPTQKPVQDAEPTGSLPKFRWPVQGRVISGFAQQVNGQPNDGINISVPENTMIKAAEDGTVAYAGNELKGYGNLILIRHANGYVTAYAHAKELLVKRGDQVKRGQNIGKVGQTGNVSAPQLHFEVRKGPQPVDPTKFLTGS